MITGLCAFENVILHTIGLLSVLLLLMFGCLSAFKVCKQKHFEFVVLISLLYCIFVSIIPNSYSAIYPLFLQAALYLFAIGLCNSYVNSVSTFFLCKFLSALFLVYVISAGIIFAKYGEDYLVHNSFGATGLKIMFALSFFFLLQKQCKLMLLLLFALFLFIVGERTGCVVLFLVLFLYKLLSLNMFRKKHVFYSLFWCVMSLVLLIPFLYVGIKETDWGGMLNAAANDYTAANFYSGRDAIWNTVIEANRNAIWCGQGIGNNVLEKQGILLSTHNLYMYLYLGGGVCLVFLHSLLMFLLWKNFYMFLWDREIRFSVSFFLGLLLFLDFEMLLLGNNVVVSIYLWLIMCFGIMKINYLKKYGSKSR